MLNWMRQRRSESMGPRTGTNLMRISLRALVMLALVSTQYDGPEMNFPSTNWSLLAQTTLEGQSEARAALEELCRRYWSPLHHFIRRRGFSDTEAQDVTQEFLL